MTKTLLKGTVAGVIAMAIAAPAMANEATAISTGRTDHQLIYEVIEEGLTALGYENNEMLTGNYPAIHLSIGQGDADYTAVHWKPLHNEFFANSGGDDALVRAGPMYTNAMQAYFIDIKTAEAHGITASYQFENGTFTPYGRGEVAFIQLDPYDESGGNLALSYNKQTIDRYMLFLGSDINFDKTYKDGKLKPFAAVEYGLDLTSNSEVKMNYVGNSTVYQTELEKLASSNVMMKLGFDYEGKDQTNLAFSYERNEAIGAGHSNSIQVKFSKPLGNVN